MASIVRMSIQVPFSHWPKVGLVDMLVTACVFLFLPKGPLFSCVAVLLGATAGPSLGARRVKRPMLKAQDLFSTKRRKRYRDGMRVVESLKTSDWKGEREREERR